MCDCRKKEGFKQKLNEAKKLTEETGVQHVVFYMETVNKLFVGAENAINDDYGICCYFMPDGTEIQYVPNGNNIDVVDAENISDKKAKRK